MNILLIMLWKHFESLDMVFLMYLNDIVYVLDNKL